MRVSASKLKAHLGRFLKTVRAGKEVVVTDRGEPVARLLPFASGQREDHTPTERAPDPGAPPLGELRVESVRSTGPSSTELLADDRRRR